MNVSVVENGQYVMITRWLTAEEKSRLERSSATSLDEVRPYHRICVHKDGWRQLVNHLGALREMADLMVDSIPASYQLHLCNDIYLNIKADTYHVNIRRYWKPINESEARPTRIGVTLKPMEFVRLTRHANEILETLAECENANTQK